MPWRLRTTGIACKGCPPAIRPLEQFLFTPKPGNCEFLASAFSLVARTIGLPSRLVGGYLGGSIMSYGITSGLALRFQNFIDEDLSKCVVLCYCTSAYSPAS